jgi:hypothetical protein
MVSRKIRTAIIVFVLLATVTGLVISTVDAKTSSTKGGKVSVGKTTVKSGSYKTPSISVSLKAQKEAKSQASLGNKLSVPILGIKDVSGFNVESAAEKEAALKVNVPIAVFAPLADNAAAIPVSDGTTSYQGSDPFASQSAGPTATGNALSVPQIFTRDGNKYSEDRTVGGLAYTTALSTDFYKGNTFAYV